MLGQSSSSSDGLAAFVAVLLSLAVIGLQIYLVYAIIATRQDVRVIRRRLEGERRFATPPLMPANPSEVSESAAEPPPPGVYEVVLVGVGPDAPAVRELLESRLNYEQMDAAMLVATPGAMLLRTRDQSQAESLVEQIRRLGAIAEIRGLG